MIEYTNKAEILKGIIEIIRLLKDIRNQNADIKKILQQKGEQE